MGLSMWGKRALHSKIRSLIDCVDRTYCKKQRYLGYSTKAKTSRQKLNAAKPDETRLQTP